MTPADTSEQASRPRTAQVVLALSALLFLFNVGRYAFLLLDDAYISLRYSRHLVEGNGLVFNAGERVEGYTNFLWVLAGAGFLRAGVDAMRGLQVLSLFSALGVLVVVSRLDRSRPAVPALAFLLPLQSFGYYATTGMESMLFTLLLVGAVAVALAEERQDRRLGSSWLFVLLALTRPEGAVLFALTFIFCTASGWVRRRSLALARRARDAAVFSAGFGSYFAWRFHYYGEPLPNTFYAKVTGGSEQWTNGWLNLVQFATTHPLFGLSLFGLGVVLIRSPRWREEPEPLVLFGVVSVYLAYVLWVGGDYMPFLRFFLPILPLCALLLSRVLSALPARVLAFGGALWVLHVAADQRGEEPYRALVAHQTTIVGRDVGVALSERLGPRAEIAANAIGALAYFSRLPMLDMLGLTDKTIARHPVYVVSPRWGGHRRGFGDYVLSQRPRAVLFYNSAGLGEPHYLGDHQLADNPYFRFFYQLKREELPLAPGAEDHVLARFFGTPFGDSPTGSVISSELGARFDVLAAPVKHTVARPSPIVLHYFEWRSDRTAFWELSQASGKDLARFLDGVVAGWRSQPIPVGDAEAQRQETALCERALASLRGGDRRAARELLQQALVQNRAAGLPLVYQYLANLAVLERDLFPAVQAQSEALRYEPGNPLYRRNLESLLSVPFKTFRERRAERVP